MDVKDITLFLKKYGLASPDDDQGAASLDFIDPADAISVDFDFELDE